MPIIFLGTGGAVTRRGTAPVVRTGYAPAMCPDDSRRQAPGGSEVSFEEIYLRAGPDFSAIPWAALAPHPALVAWLDTGHLPPASGTHPDPAAGSRPAPGVRPDGDTAPVAGRSALIVGCGLGDDAEEAARRGYRVTAFDLSPTAIRDCRHRFPGSAVDYQVADLFRLPASWNLVFDLVVEIRTLQSLPLAQRADAATAIAATVRPGGWLFVHCLGRGDDEPATSRPWPVSQHDLSAFGDAGLRQAEFRDQPIGPGQSRSFTVSYTRPDDGHTVAAATATGTRARSGGYPASATHPMG
jgi:SAM-dependent methyltransferase